MVNGSARRMYFRRKQTQSDPKNAIFGAKPAHFRAKWDEQMSVNYVSGLED
jgi:hypothetical protein